MKKRFCMILVLILAAVSCIGLSESLYVDNRETDKNYPERLNLRTEPSANGAILGLYYTGAQVDVLGVEETYTKIQIGGVTGYMASEYLIDEKTAIERYGEESGFGDCREAQVNLSGLWQTELAVLEAADAQAQQLTTVKNGDKVRLVGILGDDWAFIRAEGGGESVLGYVPLDALVDTAVHEAMIIAGSKADTQTMLYDAPNDRADEIMVLKNGTPCFSLFGRKEGNWVRVRVGGVAGWIRYTQADNLVPMHSEEKRSTVPYYPLVMETKGDVPLRSAAGESGTTMTLGRDMKVEVLAECGESVYVRTMEGGAGAYDRGDYGYMALQDLTLAESLGGVGVAQADDGDLPVLLLEKPEEGAAVIGALIPGAQVRITDYTQTDYMELSLGSMKAYALKSELRALGDGSEAPSERIPQRAMALEAIALLDAPGGKETDVQVGADQRVYMLARCGEWAYVQADEKSGFENGEPAAGFVRTQKLNAPQSTLKLTAFVTKDKINMRQKASREGEIVGRARLEERLRVAEYGKDWCSVVTPEGKRGYVVTEYLTFE